MGLYTTVMDGITEYTGQSPAAFFTILAMMAVVYKLACGKFVAAGDYEAVKKDNAYALREPVQLGENVTEEQLRAYDGSDPEKPLLMAIKGQIYDVSPSRRFYGPGAPYAVYAGRDASRAFALLSFEPEDITGNIEGLSASELDVLQGWEDKYMEKYVKVGQLVGAERNQIETEPTENGDKIQEAKHIEENGTQQPPTSE